MPFISNVIKNRFITTNTIISISDTINDDIINDRLLLNSIISLLLKKIKSRREVIVITITILISVLLLRCFFYANLLVEGCLLLSGNTIIFAGLYVLGLIYLGTRQPFLDIISIMSEAAFIDQFSTFLNPCFVKNT